MLSTMASEVNFASLFLGIAKVSMPLELYISISPLVVSEHPALMVSVCAGLNAIEITVL
ncbi:hypothetical protein D3C79_975020 [compost metagenome]